MTRIGIRAAAVDRRVTVPSARAKVERITASEYRIIFDRPLEAEVALMYFGFYPETRLFWKNGRVVSVIAPASTYEQIVKDFSEDAAEEDINEIAGREDF
jgi:hypothetical protein